MNIAVESLRATLAVKAGVGFDFGGQGVNYRPSRKDWLNASPKDRPLIELMAPELVACKRQG